jgi:hypothetical protein
MSAAFTTAEEVGRTWLQVSINLGSPVVAPLTASLTPASCALSPYAQMKLNLHASGLVCLHNLIFKTAGALPTARLRASQPVAMNPPSMPSPPQDSGSQVARDVICCLLPRCSCRVQRVVRRYLYVVSPPDLVV